MEITPEIQAEIDKRVKEEAEKARDLYMEYDWDKKKVKKLLRDEQLQFS